MKVLIDYEIRHCRRGWRVIETVDGIPTGVYWVFGTEAEARNHVRAILEV